MTERFVSGLPGGDLRGPRVLDPVGVSLLQALRDWAKHQADDARPRAIARFDGVDRMPADVEAIGDVHAGDTIAQLIDGLLAEPLLAQRAVQLVRRPRR